MRTLGSLIGLLLVAVGCGPTAPAPGPARPAASPTATSTSAVTPTPPASATPGAPPTATPRPAPTPTSTTVPPATPPGVIEVILMEHEFGFNFPDEDRREAGGPSLEVIQGQTVRLTVVNDGQTFHNIFVVRNGSQVYVPGKSREAELAAPGESLTIEFPADEAGEYFYICGVAGHREAGMEGSFIVKPAR